MKQVYTILLALLLAAMSVASVAASGEVVSIGSATDVNDSVVTVQISLANAVDITGVSPTITYDPSVLQVQSMTANTSVVTMVSQGTNINNTIGKAKITLTTSVPGITVVDATPLADVTFHLIGGNGTHTDVEFVDTAMMLSDKDFNSFAPTTIENGSITIGEVSTDNIVINEFVANPSSGDDWVELYNPTGSDISLDGWTLNDSSSEIESLSGVINASGYRVFEVGSRLNQNDDTITLLNGATIVDEVTYGSQTDNAPVPDTGESAGRFPNGKDTDVDADDFQTFGSPTPGTANAVTTADTTPPNTEGHDPAPDATGVPIDTSITVHVLDDGDGVNISTIVMTVNGTVVTPDGITGAKDDYTIVYTPPEDFGYDQLVNVTIDAADLNETPNVMDTDEYSFTTESEPSGNGGSGSGGSGGDGTYPPGWGEGAPSPAATSAPEEAASPAPTKAPTVAPTKAPTKAPTVVATETTTTEMKTEGTPGFGAVLTVFAIAGLLVAAYLVMRRRE